MEYKQLRLRIPLELHKRYKWLCVQKDLSLPRQTTALIRNFVDIQEENDKRIKNE